jgi:hypothetical protein
MFGFFSEYEFQSQIQSLMSILRAATAVMSKSNAGEESPIVMLIMSSRLPLALSAFIIVCCSLRPAGASI